MNNMKRYSVSALLSIACAMTVQAQTNNELPSRSMTVEGDYNPVFTEAAKIMPSPRKEEVGIYSSCSKLSLCRERKKQYLRG